MVGAAVLSVAGLIAHNLAEFSVLIVVRPETLVPLAATAVLVGFWWRRPRRGALLLLSVWAGLQLGLGVAAALPLSVLPFVPEQTIGHYTAHVVYAAAQVPLLWLGLRPSGNAATGVPRRPSVRVGEDS